MTTLTLSRGQAPAITTPARPGPSWLLRLLASLACIAFLFLLRGEPRGCEPARERPT